MAELDLEVGGLDADLDLERIETTDLEFLGEPIEGMDAPDTTVIDEGLLEATRRT